MRNLRRGFVVGVCVLSIAVGAMIAGVSSTHAAWEELPAPPITLAPDWLELDEDTWKFTSGFCMPFLVADGNTGVYLGHASEALSYDRWYVLDTESMIYSTLAEVNLNQAIPEDCLYQNASGAYVDEKVYVIADSLGRLSEYDPIDNSWDWASLTSGYEYLEQALVADDRHEVLNWIEVYSVAYYDYGLVKSIDPDVGEESLKTLMVDYFAESYIGMDFSENEVYIAGGYYLTGTGLFEYPYGVSSQISARVNLHTGDSVEMEDVPRPTAMVGSGWGTQGLHYIGFRLQGSGASVFYMPSWVLSAHRYHYIYQPASNRWDILDNDLPEDCLPFSVVKNAEWLYGVFACADGSDLTVKMFRSEIGEYTEPPSDDDLGNDDTTDDDTSDDDTSDDDASDDDSMGDDDAAADDTTSPNANAPADGDDDDDACGC